MTPDQHSRRSFLSHLAGTLAGMFGGAWVFGRAKAAPSGPDLAEFHRLANWATVDSPGQPRCRVVELIGRMPDGRYRWCCHRGATPERPYDLCELGYATEVNGEDIPLPEWVPPDEPLRREGQRLPRVIIDDSAPTKKYGDWRFQYAPPVPSRITVKFDGPVRFNSIDDIPRGSYICPSTAPWTAEGSRA